MTMMTFICLPDSTARCSNHPNVIVLQFVKPAILLWSLLVPIAPAQRAYSQVINVGVQTVVVEMDMRPDAWSRARPERENISVMDTG
jgi:hypothetical protein